MPQQELLDWVNRTVNGEYTKIEELRSGAAYCQMMEMLFPNCIGGGINKINKRHTELDCVYRYNLKLLQEALIKLQFEKTVPIERLMTGNSKDNLKFLQWFKIFFDTHVTGNKDLKLPNVAEKLYTQTRSTNINCIGYS